MHELTKLLVPASRGLTDHDQHSVYVRIEQALAKHALANHPARAEENDVHGSLRRISGVSPVTECPVGPFAVADTASRTKKPPRAEAYGSRRRTRQRCTRVHSSTKCRFKSVHFIISITEHSCRTHPRRRCACVDGCEVALLLSVNVIGCTHVDRLLEGVDPILGGLFVTLVRWRLDHPSRD